MRSRRIVPLAAIVLAVAAGAVTFAVTRASGGGPGPLDPGIDGGVGLGLTANVGQPESVSGSWVIRNPSDHQLVLDRVEVVGLRHGPLKMLGAYVMPLSHYEPRGAWAPYRVPSFGRALPGAVIGPHAKLQLVFGLKATEPGRHTFTAMRILYHDGSGSYRLPVELAVADCAPVTVKVCNDPLWAPGS